MTATHTVCTLLLLYSLTCTLTVSATDNIQPAYEESPKSEEPPPLTPKQHLFMFTIDGFTNLTKFYVNSAANISEAILKDATLNTLADNNVVREFKKNLTEFLLKYEKQQEFEDQFELVELYSNTTSDYYEMPSEHMTYESKTIVNTLRKHGSEQLDKEFEKKYDEYVKDFSEEFEKVKMYLDGHMLDWFKEFKTITNMNKRTESFEKFIMFYL